MVSNRYVDGVVRSSSRHSYLEGTPSTCATVCWVSVGFWVDARSSMPPPNAGEMGY